MKASRGLLTILLLSLVLSAHGQTNAPTTIRLQTSRADVITALGNPVGTLKHGHNEVLVYAAGDVQLRDGSVVKVGEAFADPADQVALVPEEDVSEPTAPAVGMTGETNATTDDPAASAGPANDPSTATNQATPPAESPDPAPTESPAASSKIVVFLSTGLIALGLLAATGGNIWLIVKAFKEHIAWGLACLFVPVVIVVFAIKYWRQAWMPFALSMAGTVVMVGGLLLLTFGAGGF